MMPAATDATTSASVCVSPSNNFHHRIRPLKSTHLRTATVRVLSCSILGMCNGGMGLVAEKR